MARNDLLRWPDISREYRGDAFAAAQGPQNRSKRTGYKPIRLRMVDGHATGKYDDFVTTFVTEAGVRGHPSEWRWLPMVAAVYRRC